MVGWRTLGKAIELGALGVLVHCSKCINVGRFSAQRALRLFGADTLITDIAKRCRCRCGARDKWAVADWKRLSPRRRPAPAIALKKWGRLP